MPNKSSGLKRKLCAGLAGLICLLPAGCRNLHQENCTKGFPLGIIELSTRELLSEEEIFNFYKGYFPDNKPQLSYKFDTKRAHSRLFLSSKGNFKEGFNYDIYSGIEIKF